MKEKEKTKEQLVYQSKVLRRQVANAAAPHPKKTPESLIEAQGNNESVRRTSKMSDNEKAWSEAIIAAIGDGIRIIDTNFKILYENQKHKDLLGDHVGEYCFSAYQQKERVCEICPVVKAFNDGQIHKAERAVPTKADIIHLGITASPLRDSTGRIIAGVVVARDITKRKLMEADREDLIVELKGALAKIKTLKGLIPVCAWCKKVRNDRGYWDKLENYMHENFDADFTHGICPECAEKM
jgi:PAS domain S-box-containing protein